MKTVSLGLSKQLKEAGYPQEGQTFDWVLSRHDEKTWVLDYSKSCGLCSKSYNGKRDDFIASPTADEVLEKLPSEIQKDGHFYSIAISKTRINHFWVDYRYFSRHKIFHLRDYEYSPIESLANAAAKIWLYLKEKGFITE